MRSLVYLKSRRMWYIRDLTVYGLASDAELFYLGVESVESTGRLMFGRAVVGDSAQNILFADLVDDKGNNLPETIKSPRVSVSTRSRYNAFLVGEESDTGFRIARDETAPGPINVNLFIFETG